MPPPDFGLFAVKPFTDVEVARQAVEQFDGSPEDFSLPISDVLQDPMGITMAVITDAVLAKGWDLDGFDQRDGYRIYKYKVIE